MNIHSNRRWSLAFTLVGLLLFTASCKANLATVPVLITKMPQAASSEPIPLDEQALGNIEYTGIYDQPVKLSAGEYVGPPFEEGGASRPTVTLQGITAGDLNQDSLDDAVVLLAENSGGSGTFIYLAAVLNNNGDLLNTSTISLGDRVRVESIQVVDGKILVSLLAHAPEDPLCCPTQKVEKTYLVYTGQLIPVENE